MELATINILKILFLTGLASVVAIFVAPQFIEFLNRYKLWKKEGRKKTIDSQEAEVFYKLNKEREVSVPRLGGVLIWGVALLLALAFAFLANVFPDIFWFDKLDFLSRSQTWLPMFALVAAALIGLTDDILQVKGKGKYIAGGLDFWKRVGLVSLIGLIGGLWFYFKLGADSLHIPGNGELFVGPFYILIFIIVNLACWSGGVIDGLDGLAGGAFASMFAAFGIISFSQNQIDLAAFCGVITGTLFSFLWFNIPPAKFYMGETGSLALTSALAVVAFLSKSVLVLPIIGGLLVLEAGSVILQLLSKKYRGKKIFLSTPIHHHLEAKGWTAPNIVMRLWIVGLVLAIIGVTIRLLG